MATKTKKDDGPGFSEASAELDKIIDTFRNGDLTLEEALSLFEKGVGHLKICQGKLGEAKGSVDELVKTLAADGQSVTRPFEEE